MYQHTHTNTNAHTHMHSLSLTHVILRTTIHGGKTVDFTYILLTMFPSPSLFIVYSHIYTHTYLFAYIFLYMSIHMKYPSQN